MDRVCALVQREYQEGSAPVGWQLRRHRVRGDVGMQLWISPSRVRFTARFRVGGVAFVSGTELQQIPASSRTEHVARPRSRCGGTPRARLGVISLSRSAEAGRI